MLTGLRAIATSSLLITAFLAAQTLIKAPKFERIYYDMLGGEPLPLLTTWLLDFWLQWIILVAIISIAAIAFVWWASSPAIVGFVSLGASLALFAIFWLAQQAQWSPLFEIINRMGQA